jgi:heme/copper-type cytochrome/quinol oxidase subunit 2
MILVAILSLVVMSIVAYKVYQYQKAQTKTENQTSTNVESKKQVNTLLTDPLKADKPGDF